MPTFPLQTSPTGGSGVAFVNMDAVSTLTLSNVAGRIRSLQNCHSVLALAIDGG